MREISPIATLLDSWNGGNLIEVLANGDTRYLNSTIFRGYGGVVSRIARTRGCSPTPIQQFSRAGL